MVGILVHRLLQRAGFSPDAADEELGQLATTILRATQSTELSDWHDVTRDAIARYRQLASQEDLREIYRAGQPYHEVPFTMQVDGQVVRGSMDCLIASPDRITVVEFKTGRPRAEHQAQAAVYKAAAEALFPGILVDSRLVYTSESVVARAAVPASAPENA
jgi:ATP-dependent helicase/nuclease subunit A